MPQLINKGNLIESYAETMQFLLVLASLDDPQPNQLLIGWLPSDNFLISSLLYLLVGTLFSLICIYQIYQICGLGGRGHCSIQQIVIVTVIMDFDVHIAPGYTSGSL